MSNYKAFLLFEVLVAILISATALVALLQGLGSAIKAGTAVSDYFIAACLADSKISILQKDVSVKPGTDSGKFSNEEDPGGKFSWEQKITEVARIGSYGSTELPMCNVEITVKWKGRKEEQKVKLVTYLLKYEESKPER